MPPKIVSCLKEAFSTVPRRWLWVQETQVGPLTPAYVGFWSAVARGASRGQQTSQGFQTSKLGGFSRKHLPLQLSGRMNGMGPLTAEKVATKHSGPGSEVKKTGGAPRHSRSDGEVAMSCNKLARNTISHTTMEAA